MADLDAISDRTYAAAGADFAFVITRRGRLVTRRAPSDMPREGRSRIVDAAVRLGEQGRLGHVEMPREELVPYGGAAPIDVYFGVAAEAILCVVMPTWADRHGVLPAIEHGLRAIDEGTPAEPRPARAGHRRSPSRPRGEAAPSLARRQAAEVREPPPSTCAAVAPCEVPPSPSHRAAPPSSPARRRSAVAGLVVLANGGPPRSLARPVLRDAPPPPAGSPRPAASPQAVRIGEAPLGRERLATIDRELGGPPPSLPEIRVGAASVGHETLAAIEAELQQPARPGSTPEALRFDLVSISRESLLEIAAEEARQATAGPRPSMPLVRPERLTRPRVEAPEDARRVVEAEKLARKTAPPEVSLEPGEPGAELTEAALAERRAHPG
ncbi:hypothetical protein [Sorangium sp. So ce1335]|uniref:hypothetical protein n=1 Tax=Sorangium sp. So ce1335 TaxID=3133335 RepID=UPI003F601799